MIDYERSPAFELKLAGAPTETGEFVGYGAVFDAKDSFDDVILPGAFKASLEEHRRKGRMPLLLWQHERDEPIGAWREMKEDNKGLLVKGALFRDDIPKARQAHTLLKGGGLSGLSIGYNVVESEMDHKAGVRRLLKLDLAEISLVSFPAADAARVIAVKANDLQIREVGQILLDAGVPKNFVRLATRHGFAKAKAIVDRRDAGGGGDDLVETLRRAAGVLTTTNPGDSDEQCRSKIGG